MALFPIIVRSLISAEEFIITVNPKDTIRSIKRTLEDYVNILADNQILIHRGEILEDKRNLVELDVRNLVELDVRGYIILVEKGLYLAIDRDNGREVYDLLKNEKLLLSECKNLSNPCMESNRFPGVLRCIDIFTSTAVAGYVDLLSLLLRMRLITDVNQLDNKGNNAGHYAASIGSIKILKLLFDYGLDKEMKNKKNESMIEIACIFYHRYGTFISPIDYSVVTAPIHTRSTRLSSLTTTLARESNIIRFLIEEKGCSQDTKNCNGSTLISYATYHRNITVCEELISLRCDLDIKDNNGDTPFLIACREGFLEIANLLLNAGCNHFARSRDGSFPLMICCAFRQLDICKELLARRFDTEETNNDGDTTLLLACERNDIVFCNLLLESGCNPNATNNFGTNALMNGGKKGNLEICRILLSAGCDKDAKDKDGDNLLIHVCRNGHLDACKMLIEVVGCDKEVKNNNGKNAFLLSSQYGHLDVCKYLIDSGVETSATDNRRYTALHLASQSNKFDIVRLLVNYGGVDLVSIDSNGNTAQDLVPSWSTSRDEMCDFFKTEINKRQNHGFKREMLAGGDFNDDDDKVQEIVGSEDKVGGDAEDQNLSKKARFEESIV